MYVESVMFERYREEAPVPTVDLPQGPAHRVAGGCTFLPLDRPGRVAQEISAGFCVRS
jgi:hypothetical protein